MSARRHSFTMSRTNFGCGWSQTCLRFRVQGSGFGVSGFKFRLCVLGFRLGALGFGTGGLGFGYGAYGEGAPDRRATGKRGSAVGQALAGGRWGVERGDLEDGSLIHAVETTCCALESVDGRAQVAVGCEYDGFKPR